jgi:hypothetical protein
MDCNISKSRGFGVRFSGLLELGFIFEQKISWTWCMGHVDHGLRLVRGPSWTNSHWWPRGSPEFDLIVVFGRETAPRELGKGE